MRDFLNVDDKIREYFTEDSFKEANKTMFEFFYRIFSEARRIAIDEKRKHVNISISQNNWLEGYWSTVGSLRLKKRYQLWLLTIKVLMFLLPVYIGYALSNPKDNLWQIIIGFFVSAILFVISEKLEVK